MIPEDHKKILDLLTKLSAAFAAWLAVEICDTRADLYLTGGTDRASINIVQSMIRLLATGRAGESPSRSRHSSFG